MRKSPASASSSARRTSTSTPPASAAVSTAIAASLGGLSRDGLPSYQPPYIRQTLRTTNSGSS